MRFQAAFVENPGMRGEDVARRAAGREFGGAGVERLHRDGVVAFVQRLRPADHMRSHDRRMIVAADASEFERQLVVGVELAPPALVAAEQRVGARADDELVAGIIAAGGENGVMHRGENLALVGASRRGVERRLVGEIGEARGLAHAGQFQGRFAQAQPGDEAGDVGQFMTNERGFEPAAVEMGEALRVVFDAEPAPGVQARQHRGEVARRLGLGAVLPDADVGDIGRMLRLPEIGGAGQQRRATIRADIEALEEAEAEGVVAGEPVVAFGREQQRAVELLRGEGFEHAGLAGGHFGGGEVDGHDLRTPEA